MPTASYKLQLTKGFFADFDQIARLLTYAVQHQDKRRIPPEGLAKRQRVTAA